MMPEFQGKPPGSGAGEMSARTGRLRPRVALSPAQVVQARRLRRAGHEPDDIATSLGVALDEIEKVLMQMRSPRPETTRGTLNVTLAAHKVIMRERVGNEPLWRTMDRLVDELLRLRAATAAPAPTRASSRPAASDERAPQLPLFPGT